MPSVVIEMSGDEARLWRSLVKIQSKNNDVDESFKKVKRSGQDAGVNLERWFGNKASSYIGSLASQYLTLGAGIQFVGSALRFAKQESDQAIESFRKLAEPERALSQIATSEEDLRALTKRADVISQKTGISREATRNLLFSARSEGFEDAVDFIAKNAIVVAPEAQATVAGQLPSLFKGKISATQAINATLVAAEASRLNFEALARAAPGAAEGGAVAGASPEETLALLSVLASRFKSGETAADRIKAFGVKVGIDERFKGMGMLKAFREIQKMSEEEREEFLGTSAELNTVFAVLSEEIDVVEKRMELIADAIRTADTEQSRIAQKRGVAERVFGARTRLEGAERGVEISREVRKEAAIDVDIAFKETLTDLKRTTISDFSLFIAETQLMVKRMLFGNNFTPEQIQKGAADAATPFGIGASRVRNELDAIRAEREAAMSGSLSESAKALREAADLIRNRLAELGMSRAVQEAGVRSFFANQQREANAAAAAE